MPRQLKIPNYSYKGGLVKATYMGAQDNLGCQKHVDISLQAFFLMGEDDL